MNVRLLSLLCGLLLSAGAETALAAINFTLLANYDSTRDSNYPAGNKPLTPTTCPAGWTCDNKGTADGSINEISASSFTIAASGNDDEGDIDYVYQSCGTGDCQIEARIPLSWTGHLENFTGFGVGMTESTADAAWYAQAWWNNAATAPVCKWGTPGPDDGNLDGTTATLPEYVAITHADTANELKCWQSDDGSTWTQVGTTISRNVSEPLLAYVFGTSADTAQTTSALITNIAFSTTVDITGGGGPPPPVTRDLLLETDFETGQFRGPTNQDTDGAYQDAHKVNLISSRATFTVTNITNHATAPVMTWSGADPVFTNPDTGTNGGFRITGITGMTGAEGQLYRCTSIDTGANTCTLRQDGTGTANTSDGNQVLGDNNVNTTGFGTFSGTATANLWERDEYNTAGGLGGGTEDLAVVTTATPPNNLNGSASAFSPLLGDYFLSSTIYRFKDYSSFPGNSDKNKSRWTAYTDSATDIDYNEEACISFAAGLPSNYDHNERTGVNPTELQIFSVTDTAAGDEPAWLLGIVGGGAGLADRWNLQLDFGTTATSNDIDLGAVTDGINKYTIWTINFKLHATNGFIEVYRGYADSNGANPTTSALVYSRGPGVGVGSNPSSGAFNFHFRNYKYGWNHNTNTTPSDRIWMAIDEIRLTRMVADAATCQDVHPFSENISP